MSIVEGNDQSKHWKNILGGGGNNGCGKNNFKCSYPSMVLHACDPSHLVMLSQEDWQKQGHSGLQNGLLFQNNHEPHTFIEMREDLDASRKEEKVLFKDSRQLSHRS